VLYYRQPQEMVKVARRAKELAPIMIVQANIGTRTGAAQYKAEKSSLSYLENRCESVVFTT
jgi:predicted CoA-binding protein